MGKPSGPPDLNARLRKLRDKYAPWQKVLPVCVWMYPKRASKRNIVFGIYASDEQVIYISLVLAADWVPKEVLDAILWHELCHTFQDQFPVKNEPDHSKRFFQWEALYPKTQHANLWEAVYIEQLLAEQNRLVGLKGVAQPLPHPARMPASLRPPKD
jgi:predicted metal-dependent hydrolase